jgi:hypothetical protein
VSRDVAREAHLLHDLVHQHPPLLDLAHGLLHLRITITQLESLGP